MTMQEDKIQLPLDTGNTGKMKRTRSRTIGANTVHEDFVVLSSDRNYLCKPRWESGLLTIPSAAQNGTATGLIWLFNPTGSGVKCGINRITLSDQFTALAVDAVAGLLSVNRFTFTGTPTGGTITPAPRITTDDTPVVDVRTASTGMNILLGGRLFSKQLQTMGLATGGAGAWSPSVEEYAPDSDEEQIILLGGEGIVIWSSVAVTTSNRRAIVNGMWEEFTDSI